jgi:hypothetical protein
VSYADRTPTLEELAEASGLSPAFPSKSDFYADKRSWMENNTTWATAYKYAYLFRRHVVEVVAHKTIDAASISMAKLSDYIKQGGNIDLPIIYVGTTVPGATANWDGKNAAPAGTYCLTSLQIQDQGNGGAVVTGNWRAYGKWYLYNLNAVST